MDGMSSLRSSRRGRTQVVFTAVLAMLLLALVAINSPLTFAQSSTASQATLTSQTTGLATTSSSAVLLDASVQSVAKSANPAVVTITNLQSATNPRTGRASSTLQPVDSGSGYIISQDGYVVTNNHVTAGGSAFSVEFMDGTTADATLAGADEIQDVAVLKLDLKAGQTVPAVVSFGDSSKVVVGDQVVAIGTPYGQYTNSVSTGIVNAIDRTLDEGNGRTLPNLIQDDAPIYPGNSGGPLLNLNGEVIGMNVAAATDPTSNSGASTTGIYFAIESNAVKAIADQIIKTGSYDRAYIGIQSQLTQDGQTVVVAVEPNTPAEKAGLQVDDVITAVDGNAITDAHPFADQLLFDHQPGDVVKLTVQRNGASMDISVTLGVRPAAAQ